MARSAKPQFTGSNPVCASSCTACYNFQVRTRLLNLHNYLDEWQKPIIKAFQFLEFSIIAIGWMGSSIFLQQPDVYDEILMGIGQFFGSMALLLYSLTLIPGILKRLQLWQEYTLPVAQILTLFRRHMGILMFLMLFVHLLFMFVLPLAERGELNLLGDQIRNGQLWGFLALFMLLPLWITSNDTSVQLLGSWRTIIHRLTYVILAVLILHAYSMGSAMFYWLLLISGALVFSWVRQRELSSSR